MQRHAVNQEERFTRRLQNGAVVRKHIGYGAIGAEHAAAFQKFYTAYFNPHLNYHRPCGFAEIQTRARGKKRRVYRTDDYQTPFEKLTSLADWQQYLKDGVNCRIPPPPSQTHQRHRSSSTDAKGKACFISEVPWQGISMRFTAYRWMISTVLSRERGLKRRPKSEPLE